MATADKVDVLAPVDVVVFYGIDGKCYQTQGCSILGLLEFRRWHKVFVAEVGKISQMVEAEPLFVNAKFMDFYYLSLDWEDPQVFEVVFPYWEEWAEDAANGDGITPDDVGDYVDVKLVEFSDKAIKTCDKFNFKGPTLANACHNLLSLNGINPATITRQTFYELLFDHVADNGLTRPGRLIALNKPEPIKRHQNAPPSNKPKSEVDPAYQAIAGLVAITEDLEKALAIAQNYPAKVIDGVATAMAEQRETATPTSGGSRRLDPDELQDVLSTMSAPIKG